MGRSVAWGNSDFGFSGKESFVVANTCEPTTAMDLIVSACLEQVAKPADVALQNLPIVVVQIDDVPASPILAQTPEEIEASLSLEELAYLMPAEDVVEWHELGLPHDIEAIIAQEKSLLRVEGREEGAGQQHRKVILPQGKKDKKRLTVRGSALISQLFQPIYCS